MRLWTPMVMLSLIINACDPDEPAPNASRETIYTLYRSSAVNDSVRIHVASFDTSDGETYNRDNCEVATLLSAATLSDPDTDRDQYR